MSEKLYAVKNDDGKYWDFKFAKFRPISRVYYPAYIDEEHAKGIAHAFGGHIVTLIKEPKKVRLSKKAAEWVASIKNNERDITDIFDEFAMPEEVSDWLYDDDNGGERSEERGLMLVNAYQYGYTVAKEKKYNVKVPHAVNSYFKKIDANYCIAGNASIVDLDEYLAQFTESEIEHYGLQDCEKEEVTDDEQ